MIRRALGCVLMLALGSADPGPLWAQECPVTRPKQLINAIAAVVGQSPMWLTVGRGPLAWKAPDQAFEVLWVRDRAVPGPVLVSGQERTTKAKVRVGPLGSSAGFGSEKFRFDPLGTKPRLATQADLQKYSFHMTSIHFPVPGCYEMTAQVGRQTTTIYLQVQKGATR